MTNKSVFIIKKDSRPSSTYTDDGRKDMNDITKRIRLLSVVCPCAPQPH